MTHSMPVANINNNPNLRVNSKCRFKMSGIGMTRMTRSVPILNAPITSTVTKSLRQVNSPEYARVCHTFATGLQLNAIMKKKITQYETTKAITAKQKYRNLFLTPKSCRYVHNIVNFVHMIAIRYSILPMKSNLKDLGQL